MVLILKKIIYIVKLIGGAISDLFIYRGIFAVVGFFTSRKFPPAKEQHKYAILISARNEEKVIGKLLDSIHAQDYPAELIDVFVVADNCTDRTADIARGLGAHVYERFDPEHRTKGYALQYLVNCIKRDHGIFAFEAYFIFDADNLLRRDYISRMNESFDAGEKIVTSFRNTKNFDDNWISAAYALHWIRTALAEHRGKSIFRLASRIQGTGFMFAAEVIKDGWNYVTLTEDRAFCCGAVADGYKISYNDRAEFFDEQPTRARIALRQRIRWSKGHLQAFAELSPRLFGHIFVTRGMGNRDSADDTPRLVRFLKNIRFRIMSFDMLSICFPLSLKSVIQDILIFVFGLWLVFASGAVTTLEQAPAWITALLRFFRADQLTFAGVGAPFVFLGFSVLSLGSLYISDVVTAAYVFVRMHRRIPKIKWYRKVWYCLTFPIFDFTDRLSISIALVSHVEWKPIPHDRDIDLSSLDR